MLCNQQVKQLCCHFFCLLVDKREQRPHSQSGSTNHGVKTITSPWDLFLGVDGSARKACLHLLMQTQHRFSRLHLGGLTASACPLPSPGRRQNHYIPMEFILGCRRLRSKSLLAFAYANATPLFFL